MLMQAYHTRATDKSLAYCKQRSLSVLGSRGWTEAILHFTSQAHCHASGRHSTADLYAKPKNSRAYSMIQVSLFLKLTLGVNYFIRLRCRLWTGGQYGPFHRDPANKNVDLYSVCSSLGENSLNYFKQPNFSQIRNSTEFCSLLENQTQYTTCPVQRTHAQFFPSAPSTPYDAHDRTESAYLLSFPDEARPAVAFSMQTSDTQPPMVQHPDTHPVHALQCEPHRGSLLHYSFPFFVRTLNMNIKRWNHITL